MYNHILNARFLKGVFAMRFTKHAAAWLLLTIIVLTTGCALAAQSTYVFPYEGLRYTQQENETVLTQTNLAEHEALIASLGTTADAILASYMAAGIVMEVIPQEGGQIAVFEVMTVNPAVQNLIRDGRTHQIDNAIFSGAGQGMISMDGELQRLYRAGTMTREVALTYAVSPETLAKRL